MQTWISAPWGSKVGINDAFVAKVKPDVPCRLSNIWTILYKFHIDISKYCEKCPKTRTGSRICYGMIPPFFLNKKAIYATAPSHIGWTYCCMSTRCYINITILGISFSIVKKRPRIWSCCLYNGNSCRSPFWKTDVVRMFMIAVTTSEVKISLLGGISQHSHQWSLIVFTL